MNLVIRTAVPEDASRLAHIEVVSWRTAYHGLMPDAYLAELSDVEKAGAWYRHLAKHRDSTVRRTFVAIQDDEATGFVSVGVDPDELNDGLVYLIYLLPERWGTGIGTGLMNVATAHFRTVGLDRANLWVLRENLRARRFYERLGWKSDGAMTSADYGGVVLEAMRYRLAIAELTNKPDVPRYRR
ncbi:MAG: GNAT family N-acetyltransferase [Candidatus Poribacteria bacterium]|nr:GNAT family N-acetyltransferase [Candidatus Poribacteria bacterium]